MKIHALSSQPHYRAHLEAIFRHIPEDLKGQHLHGGNVTARELPHDDVVMVAGYGDVERCGARRVVYVEHGAGQSYLGADPHRSRYYNGGDHPANVIAYLGPRQDVIDRWGREGFACGSPICDPYELYPESQKVAAFAFHWRGDRVAPEAGTALTHWAPRLGEIIGHMIADGWTVVGTRHPRSTGWHSLYSRHGVAEVSADHVRRHASLLLVDNSSLGYEMSYLCRPVYWLNAPWYRRDVHHGLRFWRHIPGPQFDEPDELLAHFDGDHLAAHPATDDPLAVNEHVYGAKFSDGRDGWRGAAWVSALVRTL